MRRPDGECNTPIPQHLNTLHGLPPEKIEEKARQVCTLYRKAAQEVVIACASQNFPEDWVSRLTVKADLMEAQAEYRAALVAGDKKKHSEQILHLQKAHTLLLQQYHIIDKERLSAACSSLIAAIKEATGQLRRPPTAAPGSAAPLAPLSTIDMSRLFSRLPLQKNRIEGIAEVRKLRRATETCLSDLYTCGFLTGLPYIEESKLMKSPKALSEVLKRYGGPNEIYDSLERVNKQKPELEEWLVKMTESFNTVPKSDSDECKELVFDLKKNELFLKQLIQRVDSINTRLIEYGEDVFDFSQPETELVTTMEQKVRTQQPVNYDRKTFQLADDVCAKLFQLMFERHQLEQSFLKLGSDGASGTCSKDGRRLFSELLRQADESIKRQEDQMSRLRAANGGNPTLQPPESTGASLADLVHLFTVINDLFRDLFDCRTHLRTFVDLICSLSNRIEKYVNAPGRESTPSVPPPSPAEAETAISEERVPEHKFYLIKGDDSDDDDDVGEL